MSATGSVHIHSIFLYIICIHVFIINQANVCVKCLRAKLKHKMLIYLVDMSMWATYSKLFLQIVNNFFDLSSSAPFALQSPAELFSMVN